MGLMERLNEGPVLCAEGYLFELERRGYLQAGAYVPEVVLEHPEVVAALHREFAHAGSDVIEAALAQPGDALARARLLDAQLDAGMAHAEGVDGPRQHAGSGRREGGHAQAPAPHLGKVGQGGLGGLEPAEDRGRVLDQRAARLGQHDAAGAALEQHGAGFALQRGDLLRDGRRGVGEDVGGLGQRSAPGYLPQHAQTANVQHDPRLPPPQIDHPGPCRRADSGRRFRGWRGALPAWCRTRGRRRARGGGSRTSCPTPPTRAASRGAARRSCSHPP